MHVISRIQPVKLKYSAIESYIKQRETVLLVEVKYDGLYVDGQRISIRCGEVHYWRIRREKWDDIVEKVKGMGFNAISTYIPWEIHEIDRGEFDFGEIDSSKDINEFINICERKGLWFLARPGPQINAELTWFGYPRRILEDPEIQARTPQGTKAILTQVPKPIPALSYASEKFFKETAIWYDAIVPILKKHQVPNGNLIAVQVDNEMGFFFHINPYTVDYSEDSIKKYREFLRKKYRDIEELNRLYRANYSSFNEIMPPKRFNAKSKEELPYYIDWIEYREFYLIDALDRLAKMMRERGLDKVPIYHNYPHPLNPGIASAPPTTPFNLPELERRLNFVGFDIYAKKELYDHVKTVVSYVVGTSRYPFIPEFISGIWPWYLRPGGLEDEEFVTMTALMHGIKGFSRYMIVSRNKWFGSPINRDGIVYEDKYNMHKLINKVLEECNYADYTRKSDIMLMINREYDRLEASTVLIPYPGDFLEPIFGFSEYPNPLVISEDTFGFNEPIQLRKTTWFNAHYKGLSHEGYSFVIGDTALDVEKLLRYKVLIITSYDFMSRSIQEKLIEVAKNGNTIILGPKIPYLNEYFLEETYMKDSLPSEKTEIKLNGETIAFKYTIGKGHIFHIPKLLEEVHGKVLDKVLSEAYNWKVIKNDPRLDVTVHENPKELNQFIVFIANPTPDTIEAQIELGLGKEIVKAVDIREGKEIIIRNNRLSDIMPPYKVKLYVVRVR